MAGVTTLMYHGFGSRPAEADPHNLFVPLDDFERHMRHVAERRHALSLDAFLRGGRRAGRSTLVTIDDGYVSTLEAAEVLARHRVPAVLYVCPGIFGQTSAWMPEMPNEPLLDADGVREAARLGLELGSHGMDHKLLPGLDDAELRRQVEDSRTAIADLTGVTPRTFAHPEGRFDQRVLEAVRAAGYEAAFSVLKAGGRMALPRVPVNPLDSWTTFRAKLIPGFRQLYAWTEGQRWIRRLGALVTRQRS